MCIDKEKTAIFLVRCHLCAFWITEANVDAKSYQHIPSLLIHLDAYAMFLIWKFGWFLSALEFSKKNLTNFQFIAQNEIHSSSLTYGGAIFVHPKRSYGYDII